MKTKSILLLVVSLAFGLIAAVGISQVMGGSNSDGPTIKMGHVVVSTVQLDHDTVLSEENVKLEKWPVEIIPESAITSLEELQDMAITTRLSKGLPILIGDIRHKDAPKNRLPIPKGFKVCAIKVSADDTINGLLEPGDKVDVIGVFKVRDKKSGQQVSTSLTFLRKITVFSVNSNTRRSVGPRENEGNSGSSIVGVLLEEKQAEQMVLVQKEAQLKLVLRGEDDGLDGNQEVPSLTQMGFGLGLNDGGDENDPVQAQPYDSSDDGHQMVIFDGPNASVYQENEDKVFQPKDGYTDPNAKSGDKSSDKSGDKSKKAEDADYDDLDSSNDDDRDLDEDQYPGR